MGRKTPGLRRHADGRALVRVSEKVARLIAGESDLSEWDDEEIARGQARAKNGHFAGRPPTVVPKQVYVEFARRQMDAGFQDMIGDLREVVKAVRHIATDPDVDEGTRLRAADMIMDRVYGKPKQAVDIGVSDRPRHEELIASVTIKRSMEELEECNEGEIVDAEVLEDGDEWGFDDDDEFADSDREQAWRA